MNTSVQQVKGQIPKAVRDSQLGKEGVFIILHGVTGFYSGILSKDPFAALDAALGVAEHFATKCNIGSLQDILKKANKWLKFGKEYAEQDPSDLDFDKMDVTSIPEVMKVKPYTR